MIVLLGKGEGRVYEITIRGDKKCKLAQIKKMARIAKMFFRGDENKGSFSGGPYVLGMHIAFKGNYYTEGDKLTITILEKPSLITWNQVEEVIKEYFAEDSDAVERDDGQ